CSSLSELPQIHFLPQGAPSRRALSFWRVGWHSHATAEELVATPRAAPDQIAIAKAHAVYTPAMLPIYDLLVHGLSNHVAWRCPTRRITELYRANLSAIHLEAGVGTGYFLDKTGDARANRLVLLDINRHCLER